MTLPEDLHFTLTLARDAARLVRGRLGTVAAERKTHAATHDEVVTEADRACQHLIVTRLREKFPTDGLIGEEGADGKPITADLPDPQGRIWVIDPIDGTANFVTGLPLFAVCIARLEAGVPVLGVIYDVMSDKAWYAAKGHGAFLDGTPLRVTPEPMTKGSLIMVSDDLAHPTRGVPPYIARWLSGNQRRLRILGSAALEVAQVAAGYAHGAVTLNGKLWDIAAPGAILFEAGGIVTAPDGTPIFPFACRGYAGAPVPFLAAAASAHRELLADIATQN
jgi:myo-inositol-1(or 4)-monophosphatase